MVDHLALDGGEEALADGQRPKAKVFTPLNIALMGGGVLMAVGAIGVAASPPQHAAPPKPTLTLFDDAAAYPGAPHKKESSILGAAEVSCIATVETSMTCSVKSNGIGPVKACWDVEVN